MNVMQTKLKENFLYQIFIKLIFLISGTNEFKYLSCQQSYYACAPAISLKHCAL